MYTVERLRQMLQDAETMQDTTLVTVLSVVIHARTHNEPRLEQMVRSAVAIAQGRWVEIQEYEEWLKTA